MTEWPPSSGTVSAAWSRWEQRSVDRSSSKQSVSMKPRYRGLSGGAIANGTRCWRRSRGTPQQRSNARLTKERRSRWLGNLVVRKCWRRCRRHFGGGISPFRSRPVAGPKARAVRHVMLVASPRTSERKQLYSPEPVTEHTERIPTPLPTSCADVNVRDEFGPTDDQPRRGYRRGGIHWCARCSSPDPPRASRHRHRLGPCPPRASAARPR